MKAFIALFVVTLAVAAQAGYVPSSAWPVSGVGSWNGWDGLNSWNDHNSWNGLNSWNYPYGVNQWSSAAAWPATYSNDYYGLGGKTVVQANVAKVNPWGLPLTSSYGYGYNNNNYNGWYGGKTVVQANVAKVNPWGLPLASSYGYGYNNYLGASVPAAKYVAANPGSIHIAPLVGHAINQKLIVA